jgi:hypothetical protein
VSGKKLILNQVKRASHFVKIIVACPHHLPKLPKLPESTQRNRQYPIRAHCSIVTVHQPLHTSLLAPPTSNLHSPAADGSPPPYPQAQLPLIHPLTLSPAPTHCPPAPHVRPTPRAPHHCTISAILVFLYGMEEVVSHDFSFS